MPPKKEEVITFDPSTIETVDMAFFDWLKGLNIHAETNKGFKEVPLMRITLKPCVYLKRRY